MSTTRAYLRKHISTLNHFFKFSILLYFQVATHSSYDLHKQTVYNGNHVLLSVRVFKLQSCLTDFNYILREWYVTADNPKLLPSNFLQTRTITWKMHEICWRWRHSTFRMSALIIWLTSLMTVLRNANGIQDAKANGNSRQTPPLIPYGFLTYSHKSKKSILKISEMF
jgi:hypothetical protein